MIVWKLPIQDYSHISQGTIFHVIICDIVTIIKRVRDKMRSILYESGILYEPTECVS